MFCITLILVILILTEQKTSDSVYSYDSEIDYVDLQGSSNSITGNAVLAPFSSTIGSFSCTDSDGGFNPEVKGTYVYTNLRTKRNVSKTDSCRDSSYLTEYSCVVRYRDGAAVSVVPTVNNSVLCPEGCENGACKSTSLSEVTPINPQPIIYDVPLNNTNLTIVINPNSTNLTNCVDTDGGLNYYEAGKGVGPYGNSIEESQIGVVWGENSNECSARWDYSLGTSISYDCCSNSENFNQVNEAFCASDKVMSSYGYSCPYGCEKGVCLTSAPVSDTIKDGETKTYTVNGFDYEVTAVLISNNTNYYSTKVSVNGVMTRELTANGRERLQNGVAVGISSIYGNAVTFYLRPDEKVSDCFDFDNGNIAGVKGFLTYHPEDKVNGWSKVPDVCGVKNSDGNHEHKLTCSGSDCYLIELYCSNDAPQRDFIACPQGCTDGVCGKAFDLSQYPGLFIKDGLFNGVIVVGEKAPSNEVVEAINLQASLGVANGNAKLDKDVIDLNQNIISIGSACTNTISSKLSGNPENCASGLSVGTGRIKLYTYNGYAHLIVEGFGPTELTAAVNALINYKSSSLSGTNFVVKVTTPSDCVDTDNGINNFAKGVTTITKSGSTIEKQTDSCVLRSNLQRTPVLGFFLDIISTPNYVKNCTGQSCFVNDYICNSDPSLTSSSISQIDPMQCEFGCHDGACLSENKLPVACKSFPCFFDAKAVNNAWTTVDIPPNQVSAAYPYEFTLTSSENVDLIFNSNVWPNDPDGTNTMYVELNNNIIYTETKTYDQFIKDQENKNTVRKINLGTLRVKTHTLKFYANPDPTHFMLDMFIVNKSSPISVCGNGKLEPGEECEISGFINTTCQKIDSAFVGGTLKCSNTCRIDRSGCIFPELIVNPNVPSAQVGEPIEFSINTNLDLNFIKIYYDGVSLPLHVDGMCSSQGCYYAAKTFAKAGSKSYYATAVLPNGDVIKSAVNNFIAETEVVTPQVLYPKATDLVVSQNGYYYMTVKWNNFSSINGGGFVSAYLYKQGAPSYSSSCTSYGGLSCNLSIGGTSGIYQVKLYYRNVNGSYTFANGDLFNITLQTVCGNAVVEGTEECDKYVFNGKTCGTYGFMYGSLNCTTDCKVISSGCSGIPPKITNPINGTVLINQSNINVTWNDFTRKAGTQSTAYLIRPDGSFATVVNNGTYHSCSGTLGCILVYPANLPSAYYRIRLDFTNINSVQSSIFGETFRIN